MPRILLAVALALVVGCSRQPAPTASPQPQAPAAAAGRPTLVFFMNPNGRPCQMQDQILRDMGAELGARVDVVYLKTTEPRDIDLFRQYGIRSLPTLLVTDAAGKELRRATPGIQSAAQVRQLVGG